VVPNKPKILTTFRKGGAKKAKILTTFRKGGAKHT
jgi:hypothetical protein